MSTETEIGRRFSNALVVTFVIVFLIVGYFLLFPPICYWIQDMGWAPNDSKILEALTVAGGPSRWLVQHSRLYSNYIGWCVTLQFQ